MDEILAINSWTFLETAIGNILSKNYGGLSAEECYRAAYKLTNKKCGEFLYNRLRDLLASHLIDKVSRELRDSLNEKFLQLLNQSWSDYNTSLTIISGIFKHLDTIYVGANDIDSVYKMGLKLFRKHIVRDECHRQHLSDALINLITSERRGKDIDRLAIRNACQMLIDLGINSLSLYEDVFELPFLKQTAEYFRIDEERLSKENARNFMEIVEEILVQEAHRAKQCLHKSTEERVVNVVKRTLITNKIKAVIEKEYSEVLKMWRNSSC